MALAMRLYLARMLPLLHSGIFYAVFLILTLAAEGIAQGVNETGFPERWLGDWEGPIVIERGEKLIMEVPMRLGIHRLDAGAVSWEIAYEIPGGPTRPYALRPDSTDSSHWLLDEGNGIVLDTYLYGNVLYSNYEVMDQIFVVRDELRGDTLYHEITVAPALPKHVTGDTLLRYEASAVVDTVPPVRIYPIGTRQAARLVRRSE